jgi:hypothetical protein
MFHIRIFNVRDEIFRCIRNSRSIVLPRDQLLELTLGLCVRREEGVHDLIQQGDRFQPNDTISLGADRLWQSVEKRIG